MARRHQRQEAVLLSTPALRGKGRDVGRAVVLEKGPMIRTGVLIRMEGAAANLSES